MTALLGAAGARAEDDPVDAKADAAFSNRLFAGKVNVSKSYACFVRRYDAAHLAKHPLQKVSVMKLLVAREKVPEDAAYNYSFRLGVNFRHRTGDFDSSGDCGHFKPDQPNAAALGLGCGVDCDGGGIEVALSNDDKSVIVKLETIRIWRHNKPDEEASHSLKGGADDRVFRLDRASLSDCTALVTDRKELAAMRRK
jgi:hypothetical protein